MNTPYVSQISGPWLTVEGAEDLCLFRTFDCGQCFRFERVEPSPFLYEVEGIAFSKYVRFAQNGDSKLYVYSTVEDFETLWLPFLSLDTDYEKINATILAPLAGKDRAHMERALEASRGIRILRQDPWEALCSFIISQNNNIPRIKKIIGAMCETYGERIEGGYAFPTPRALLEAGEEAIFALRTGFRAKYIYDAAKKVEGGALSLEGVRAAETYAKAEELLLAVKGVGPKVAACTLLFGFERLCAFPVDVWIKKVLDTRFEKGFDPCVFGEFAGVAQQYLFYYERYVGDASD